MADEKDLLQEYSSRRNFDKTPEPTGETVRSEVQQLAKPIYMIQRHDACKFHYDLRLQIGSLLASWAIKQGPSNNPKDVRMGRLKEYVPLDYAYFEGVIPTGEYGEGLLMVWDIGTYENMRDKSMEECVKEGDIKIFLHGKKLKGAFIITRQEGKKITWDLIKVEDEFADERSHPILTEDFSILTGRKMKEIWEDREK